MTILPCIEIAPKSPATGSVIWLHGLGASGHDFATIVPELQLEPHVHMRFILPHAPERAVTINQGYRMPAWYDITGFDLNAREEEVGLCGSEQHIHALIEREIERGIAPNQIVLAGFSQGGATAIFTGLRAKFTLKGIISLSAYCPLIQTLNHSRSAENQRTPIWIGHGTFDDVVPLQWGQATTKLLQEWQYNVSWNTYSMPHSVCVEELQDVGRWLSMLS